GCVMSAAALMVNEGAHRAAVGRAADNNDQADKTKKEADVPKQVEVAKPMATDMEKELAKFEGGWQWTGVEYQGRRPRFPWPPYYYIFKGDAFGAYDNGHVEHKKGKIKLDAANHTIDLIVTEGEEKGTTLLSGLYAWEGRDQFSDHPTFLRLAFDP